MFCDQFATRNEAEEKFPTKVCESCQHSEFADGIYFCELMMNETNPKPSNMKGENL